jgi:hypothetical protein
MDQFDEHLDHVDQGLSADQKARLKRALEAQASNDS